MQRKAERHCKLPDWTEERDTIKMSYIEADLDIWVVLNAPIVECARVCAVFALLPPVLPPPGEVFLLLANNCSVCYGLACDGINH